ncbi:MAG: hypothetical protein EZS28_019018 [Streblomastix strix]|uniref:RING-type domain-containing protein n=1 Tax=Streblomastix strix TaxID=222440 RepID=A0A5J4VS64_9EUKA|nr:MAG: hypothetical protein EZS28_019018 [Streblomastix strix]
MSNDIQNDKQVAAQVESSQVPLCCLDMSQLDDPCFQCQLKGVECAECATGKCGHTFHYHCLYNWLKDSITCPQCGIPFEYADE